MSDALAELKGKAFVVTGATSGIGLEIARSLVQAGARVCGIGRRRERLDALAAEWGDAFEGVCLNLDDPAVITAWMSGRRNAVVDGLVLAAGHDLGGNRPFHEEDQEASHSKIAVNLEAAMRLVALHLPGFLERDRGDVLAVGSIASRVPTPGIATYAATKRALHGFLEGLRLDYAGTGLRFIEMVPGVVRTEFAGARLRGDQEGGRAFYDRFPDCLRPDDVARSALWALVQPPHVAVDEIVMRPTWR